MPEPNLPPLHLRMDDNQPLNNNMVDVISLRNEVPELPHQMRLRFQRDYNLSELQAFLLVVPSFFKISTTCLHRSLYFCKSH